MVDQATADRVRMVRGMIAEYGEQIERGRSRIETLRLDWESRRSAARDLAEQGRPEEALRSRAATDELRRRVDRAEEQVDRLEEILTVVRRKLGELQRES